MEVTRVGMKKKRGQKGEQEGKAGWRRETQRGRREAAGIHGIPERDAGQSKWFLRRNNNTLEGAIRELGQQGAPDWSST